MDWLIDPSHDLADEERQASPSSQLEEVIFIAGALDCSTKSWAREIPRRFEDGRPALGPLRSEAYPDGLPKLSAQDAKRVETDNKACTHVLREIQQLHDRGGGSVKENPARSFTGGPRPKWLCGKQANGWTPPMQHGRWKELAASTRSCATTLMRSASGQWPIATMWIFRPHA